MIAGTHRIIRHTKKIEIVVGVIISTFVQSKQKLRSLESFLLLNTREKEHIQKQLSYRITCADASSQNLAANSQSDWRICVTVMIIAKM